MGQRGPKRTPTKILELRGSRKPKQQKRQDEPRPTPKKLTCPGWLDADSKRLFRTLVKELCAIDLLTALDAQALVRYCRLSTRWQAAEAFLQQHGTVMEGGTRPYPQARESLRLAAELLRIENSFGLTPSARASLHVASPEQPQSSALERFQRRGKQDARPNKARFFRS